MTDDEFIEHLDNLSKYQHKHDNNKIHILDAMMGTGKTQGIIKWMKQNPDRRYLYVSPTLTEVEERIPTACEEMGFISPSTVDYKTKGEHLLHLLKDGANVSFSHSLFSQLTNKHLEYIDRNNYTLILDEEMDFIENYSGKYTKEDVETLERSGHIRIDEGNLGRVEWIWSGNDFVDGSTYTGLKILCDMEMLHCSKRNRDMMVLHLPISLVTVTEQTIVLTYLFDGSIMHKYMEMKGMEVIPFTEVTLMKNPETIKQDCRDLIRLCDTRTTKAIKNSNKYRLTSTWYTQNATNEDLKTIENGIRSACRSYDPQDVMYTLPKFLVNKKGLSGKDANKLRSKSIYIKGYSPDDCFVYCGERATNKHQHKSVLVHAYNRYANHPVRQYLADYGFNISDDTFTLSELVQWIWRSSIRKTPPEGIKIYFLNKRMEVIFNDWLSDSLG